MEIDYGAIDAVEHAVGEASRDRTSDLAVDDLILQRIRAHPFESLIDLRHERAAEAWAMPFIPSCGRADICCRLASEDQAIRHRLRRMSSRTESQASTWSGCS